LILLAMDKGELNKVNSYAEETSAEKPPCVRSYIWSSIHYTKHISPTLKYFLLFSNLNSIHFLHIMYMFPFMCTLAHVLPFVSKSLISISPLSNPITHSGSIF
jgi:hypothetical protein